ncbi:hypothetical protein Tco_0180679 [Tanacetum coccineum]
MDPSSLKTFSDIAFQCLRKTREERPTMSRVVEELEIALESQEFPDLRLELLTKYKDILMDVDPLLIYKTGNHLKELLSKGLVVYWKNDLQFEFQFPHTSLIFAGIEFQPYEEKWFSLNEKGQHCHMISIKDCLIPNEGSTPQYESHCQSRFPAGLYQPSKGFKTHIKTQLLSPSITYSVNLVFGIYSIYANAKQRYIDFEYRLKGMTTTSTVYLANPREYDHL